MKYLAAYALLTLSGKKEISNYHSIQKLLTSRHCSARSDHRPLMMTSIESSKASRASPSTSSSPTEPRRSAQDHPPELLPPVLPRRRRLSRKNNKRRLHPRRLPLPHPLRRRKISEDSSADVIALFKWHEPYHFHLERLVS